MERRRGSEERHPCRRRHTAFLPRLHLAQASGFHGRFRSCRSVTKYALPPPQHSSPFNFNFIFSKFVFFFLLLADVKITKYGDVLEGRAIHCSSLLPLIHPYQTLVSKGTFLLCFLSYFFISFIFYFYTRHDQTPQPPQKPYPARKPENTQDRLNHLQYKCRCQYYNCHKKV